MENYGNLLAILRNVAVVGRRGELVARDTWKLWSCGSVELTCGSIDLCTCWWNSMVTAGAAPGTRIVES